MAEIDVRPTKDGELVLSHDPHHGEVVLVEHDWADLSDLEIGPGHTLGRLGELIEAVGDFPLNIEIKNWPNDPDFDADASFAIKAAALARDIDLITCFHWPTMAAIKSTYPSLSTGLLVDEGWSVPDAVEAAMAVGHSALALHRSLIQDAPGPVLEQTAPLEVYVWTVNDTGVGIRLARAGVDGLITDDPAAMVRALQGEP